MKKTLLGLAIILIWSLGLLSSEAKAQSCPNPAGCIYGNTTVTLNYSLSRVEGYSIAQADYTAGLNFHPRIEGSIYRTDFPETDLDFRTSTGNGSSVAAVINLSTTNFVSGKTYCNYTNYFAVRRSNGQISHIGFIQDCKTIALPPTPTPTPPATPTPTPPATPTPTPTPCNPSINDSCVDETIIIYASHSALQPSGVTGGNNKSRVTACVSRNGVGVPNRDVRFSVSNSPLDRNWGVHIASLHTGERPSGKLDQATGRTNANGCVATEYNPPHVSVVAVVNASTTTASAKLNIVVGLRNLVPLNDGENYRKIGVTSSHPASHWGTQGAVTALPLIANDYKDQFYGNNQIPEMEKVSYNDMSLPSGGKFDLRNRWEVTNNQHGEHREGINCDVRSNNIPQGRWKALNRIFFFRGSTNTNDETGTSAPHWHLRFVGSSVQNHSSEFVNGIEQNPSSLVETNPAPVTANYFVELVWWTVLDRESSQIEWENWHRQLVEAKAQGTPQLLEKAKAFELELFSSSEYIARNRTDTEFIEDVFNSHLLREPTVAEKEYWLNYLQNLPISLPQQRRRLRLVNEFQGIPAFEETILGIVDEIIPPEPTPTP